MSDHAPEVDAAPDGTLDTAGRLPLERGEGFGEFWTRSTHRAPATRTRLAGHVTCGAVVVDQGRSKRSPTACSEIGPHIRASSRAASVWFENRGGRPCRRHVVGDGVQFQTRKIAVLGEQHYIVCLIAIPAGCDRTRSRWCRSDRESIDLYADGRTAAGTAADDPGERDLGTQRGEAGVRSREKHLKGRDDLRRQWVTTFERRSVLSGHREALPLRSAVRGSNQPTMAVVPSSSQVVRVNPLTTPHKHSIRLRTRSSNASATPAGPPKSSPRSGTRKRHQPEGWCRLRQRCSFGLGSKPDLMVELRGFEPLTFSLRTRRATNCAKAPSGDKVSTAAPRARAGAVWAGSRPGG